MKKLFILIAFVTLITYNPISVTAQSNNVLLEYCTGTWCQWCPCGHTIIQDILANYPNTVVLGYHGAGSDPWQSYSAGIRGLMGFSAYPTGVVGRMTGIISRSAWNNQVVYQSSLSPGVSIVLNNKSYNSQTQTVTGTIVCTALQNLTGSYYLNIVITESNMIYPQTGNGSCTGGSNYVHNHVVKGMINGDIGQLLSTTDNWTSGQSVNVPLNYTIPSGFVPQNCDINFFVYKEGTVYSTDCYVQQAKKENITLVGIKNENTLASSFSLSQNYPNPFNPTTNVHFSIPKDGNVSLKIYDMLGNEVATYLDGFLKAGTYNAEIDGSNLASGIYFYKLAADGFAETKKMSLVK